MGIETMVAILVGLNGLLLQLRHWHTSSSNRKLIEKWTEQGRPDEVVDRYSRFVASERSGTWRRPVKSETSHLQLIRDTPSVR